MSKSLETIAKQFRQVRDSQRFTQADVAKKAGISTNYYAQIERAEVTFTVVVLEKIVKALNIKSSDVLPF